MSVSRSVKIRSSLDDKDKLMAGRVSDVAKHSAVIVAIIAAVASAVAAFISYMESQSVTRMQESFEQARESAEFLEAQINEFYLPMTMNLVVTKGLFDRYTEPNITDAEKSAIELLMQEHNTRMRERLMTGSVYLEPDAPEEVYKDLLLHLIQWETIYQLKYTYKVYDGWLFAGIKEFGFRRFPQKVPGYESVDDYYQKATARLRRKLHTRFTLRQDEVPK